MNSQLERYLKNISSRLWTLPHAQRDAELRELELHVVALFDTNREHGSSEEEAADAALLRFGSPEKLGNQMARKWWRGRVIGWQNSPAGLTVLLAVLIILPNLVLHWIRSSHDLGNGIRMVPVLSISFIAVWCFGIGSYIGQKLSKKALTAPLGVALIGAVLGALFTELISWSSLQTAPHIWMPRNEAEITSICQYAVLQGLMYTLFAAPAAIASRAFARRRTI